MKKLLCFILTILIIGTLFTGCTNSEKVKIGIIQIIEHPSLNTIRESIIAQLKEEGYIDGKTCTIDYKNAQGDQATLTTIVQNFSASQKDIIIAIATPTAMAAASLSDRIPVIFSAVSDPIAAKLTTSLEKPDKNITGTCDAVPVERILDMALTFKSDIKTFGFIYNAGEASSVSNIENAKKYAQSKGINVVEATVANTSEVQQAAQTLVSKADAIFTPTDNTVASAMPVLAEAANNAKIPVFVGADSMVADGGFATIGIQYTELGKETARMAARVLKGTPISDIPVKVFTDLSTYINVKTAKTLGITLTDEIKNSEKTVLLGND